MCPKSLLALLSLLIHISSRLHSFVPKYCIHSCSCSLTFETLCCQVAQEWPGLPLGVKFDPSDQEIIWHLLAKVGAGNSKPHPFIDEFITSLEVDDGICYTHPQHLPGGQHEFYSNLNTGLFFNQCKQLYDYKIQVSSKMEVLLTFSIE